jgi:hypothetical protein
MGFICGQNCFPVQIKTEHYYDDMSTYYRKWLEVVFNLMESTTDNTLLMLIQVQYFPQVVQYIVTCRVVRVTKLTGSSSDDWSY